VYECMENSAIDGAVLDKKDDLEHTCSLSSRKQYAIEQLNEHTHNGAEPRPTNAHSNTCKLHVCAIADSCSSWAAKEIVLIV